MDWEKIKWARYIIGGLILPTIPQALEQTTFITNLAEGTFQAGFAKGIFIGLRIIGVCIFAYGIAYYAGKVKEQQSE